jgi:hypothetical protein
MTDNAPSCPDFDPELQELFLAPKSAPTRDQKPGSGLIFTRSGADSGDSAFLM